MRMWNVDPKLMCDNHLRGEHYECHMFLGTIKKGISVKGYLANGLLEIHNLEKRHNELVVEMLDRGWQHKSPLEFKYDSESGYVDPDLNRRELSSRCHDCCNRQEKLV